jgi:hypothetical protein
LRTQAQDVIDLGEIRSDGWFEQLGQEIQEFEPLCQVLGTRFVAFSYIAGVRIQSISYDPSSPDASFVDFSVGDSEDVERLSLTDFRERLGDALVGPDVEPAVLPDSPNSEDLRACIGRRYVLLAPIFGIRVVSLRASEPMPFVEVDLGHVREEISVQGLRDILDNAVRSEVARARPSAPFSIDFKKIPLAEAANKRGDYTETISLLGSWPGPLSMFLRTAQGQSLGKGERSKLVKALGLLGAAYLKKHQIDWAEDVLRLGIQFGQELDAAGPLFGLLGQVRVETERHGEAIGLLRRALSLGGERASLLCDLARSFAARERYVAAMACLDDAIAEGADPAEIRDVREQVEAALGPAHGAYRLALAQKPA